MWVSVLDERLRFWCDGRLPADRRARFVSRYDSAVHLYDIKCLYPGRHWESIQDKIGTMFVVQSNAYYRRTERRFIEQSIYMRVECFCFRAMGDTILDELNIIGFGAS